LCNNLHEISLTLLVIMYFKGRVHTFFKENETCSLSELMLTDNPLKMY